MNNLDQAYLNGFIKAALLGNTAPAIPPLGAQANLPAQPQPQQQQGQMSQQPQPQQQAQPQQSPVFALMNQMKQQEQLVQGQPVPLNPHMV